MMKNPIPWLVERIFEFDPSLLSLNVVDPPLTPQQWMALRIKWGMDLGFVRYAFDNEENPVIAVCFRPVNEEILEKIRLDYAGSIWEYDSDGSILFFDFRFGKATFPFCWDLAKESGKPEIAWYYRQRLRRYRMEDIPRIRGWQT